MGRMTEGKAELLADLVASMLRNDARDRISMEQVLAHRWFEEGTKKKAKR